MESPVEQYEREGYVIFRDVLDQDLVEEAAQHIGWLFEQNPDLPPEDLGHTLAIDDPFWIRLVSDDGLLDLAEQFIGPDIALFATHYICKAPRTGQAVLWHQDGVFWPLEPMEVVSLWVAITESTPTNGCMRVIPRTHTMELLGLRERRDVDNLFDAEIDAQIDESEAVDLILNPGDVSVHHPNIVHGSEPNASDRWRNGLTIRYIPTSTRITEPEHASPFLLRGRAIDGINEYLERPAYDSGRHMAFRGAET